MTVTRADAITGTKKQKDFFSDFVTSFAKTPYGNQLGRVENENAVNQSLRNLVKTNLGERLFQPLIGSDVYASLFELNNPESLDMLEMNIRNMITNSEPRVNLIETTAKTYDSDENYIEITLIYNLINNPEPINLTLLIKRVR